MSKLPPEPKPSDPTFKKLDVNNVIKSKIVKKLMDTRKDK